LLNQLQRDGVAQRLKQKGIELGTVRCIGTCGGAPLAVIDGSVCNHQNAQTVLATLAGLDNLAELKP
jgi:bidirectional [NiFe] hydrogenase diaphorase subunit